MISQKSHQMVEAVKDDKISSHNKKTLLYFVFWLAEKIKTQVAARKNNVVIPGKHLSTESKWGTLQGCIDLNYVEEFWKVKQTTYHIQPICFTGSTSVCLPLQLLDWRHNIHHLVCSDHHLPGTEINLYARILYIEFSSAFNMIVPKKNGKTSLPGSKPHNWPLHTRLPDKLSSMQQQSPHFIGGIWHNCL